MKSTRQWVGRAESVGKKELAMRTGLAVSRRYVSSFCVNFIAMLCFVLCSSHLLAHQRQQPKEARAITPRLLDPELKNIGMRVSPTMFQMHTAPGQSDDIAVTLDNITNASDMRADLQLRAFTMAEEGWPYHFVESHPHDVIPWFKSPTDSVTVPRGKKATVKFHYKVPPNQKGYFWAVLQISTAPMRTGANVPDRSPIVSKTAVDFFLPVFVAAATARTATLAIEQPDCKRRYPTDGFYSLAVRIANSSEGMSAIGVIVDIRDLLTGRLVYSETLDDLFILPVSRRSLFIRLPSLPPGRYQARMRVVQDTRLLPPIETNFIVNKKEISSLTPEATAKLLSLSPVLIRPDSIELNIKPGNLLASVVKLINSSSNPLTLHLAPRQIKQSRDGAIGLDAADPPATLKISVFPNELTLAPGKESTVRLNVQTTRQAKGDIWFGIEAREINNPNSLAQSIIGHVEATPNAEPQLELVHSRTDVEKGYPTTVHFTLSNRGELAVISELHASIFNATGDTVIATLKVPDWHGMGILPGSILDNQVAIPPDLPPGEYILRISCQYKNQKSSILVNLKIMGRAKPGTVKHADTKTNPVKTNPQKTH